MDEVNRHKRIAIMKLRFYYLFDDRPFCVAYSGGKDSTVIVDLVLTMLLELRDYYNVELKHKVYIINSNTLAELPPVLKYVKQSIKSIKSYVKKNHLPVFVKEVVPFPKHTLNVQLFGVGMPPPSTNFRWCTTKLKVMPIESFLQKQFCNGRFISIVGSRKSESFDRATRLLRDSIPGTNLKLNTRYANASNLAPIEDWSTKDVWNYLFNVTSEYLDSSFLWKLYSDASGKDAKECSFVGAGGEHIDKGNIGCGVSRFGCWQCYMTRDKDKSLDGLYKSGYKNIEYYKAFRDWFWKETQKSWEITRDVYGHMNHRQMFYNKNNEKYGMTMPKGLMLRLRKKAFKKIMELELKLKGQQLISDEEIFLIQERWLKEGDFELSAIEIAKEYQHKFDKEFNIDNLQKKAKKIRDIFNELKLDCDKKKYSFMTLKRYAAQSVFSPRKVFMQFYPTKDQERKIRKEWKMGKIID